MVAQEHDLYQTLGVARDATEAEIRGAYRQLARQHHPDVNPGNTEAEQKFKQISAAYEVLSNSEKRKLYDEFGHGGLQSGFDAEQARAYKQWSDMRSHRPYGAESVDFNLSDLEDFFGRSTRPRRPARGSDVIAEVELSLAEALRGHQVHLRVPGGKTCAACHGSGSDPSSAPVRCGACGGSGKLQATDGRMSFVSTCHECQGQGHVRTACGSCGGQGLLPQENDVTVRIPPGANTGDRLRIAGRGAVGARGAPAGDLLVEVRVRPHPHFRRDGFDLYLDLPISLAEAYLGAEVEIPTPSSSVKLKIPAGSQPGAKLRLRGKGVKRGKRQGDLIVELNVKLPDAPSPALSDALRDSAQAYSKPVRDVIQL